MFAGIGVEILVLLVILAFVAGIGITTIGPGGIFVTIALFLVTPLSATTVAGTAHVTFIATGLAGTIAYRHSGELRTGDGRRMALVLAGASIIGALLGAHINTYVTREAFGMLLGAAAAVTGAILIRRRLGGFGPAVSPDLTHGPGLLALGALGVFLGTVAGLLGVGGPVIAVPALVLLGVPMLLGLAIAQVQSIFISGAAALGYAWYGAVDWWLVLLVGVPQLAGVLVGWVIAHRVDPDSLTIGLGTTLIIVGGYLLL